MRQPADNGGPPPSAPLPLRVNFRWTFAGNAAHAASQWGMLAVLARLGSPEVVGQFVLGLAIAAPVMAMTMLQLRTVQVTDARGEYAFGHYFGTRIAWTLAGFAVIAGCAWLGGFEVRTACVILLVGFTKCIDSVTDIVRGLFQRHERMDYSGISMMLRGLAALAAVTLLMWWTGDVILALAAVAVVWLALFVAYDIMRARRLLRTEARRTGAVQRVRPCFTWKAMLRLTRIALPLGIVLCLISLQTNIPRYVLQGYFGEEALGYFGALVYPMLAATMVTGALGQSASPRLARYYLHDLPAFRELLWKLLLLAAGLGILVTAGAILVGRPVLALLYGADYARYQREFVVVAFGGAVQLVAGAMGYGLTAARFFRTQVLLTGITCLATTLAAFLLIPTRGVMGAAATVLVTSVVMWAAFAAATFWAVRPGSSATNNKGARGSATDATGGSMD